MREKGAVGMKKARSKYALYRAQIGLNPQAALSQLGSGCRAVGGDANGSEGGRAASMEAEMAFRSFENYKRLTVLPAEEAFEVAAGPIDLAHIIAEGF
jgi:hypothetical protein